MSKPGLRIRRKQRLIADNPYCCLCGGKEPSSSEDHIPPKGCFPPGMHLQGMEFPACGNCNQATRKYDAIFGFYAMALDFNKDNFDIESFSKKIYGLLNNHTQALPQMTATANEKRKLLKRLGIQRIQGQYLADFWAPSASSDVRHYINIAIRKLTCALYSKETGKILASDYRIAGGWQQAQDRNMAPVLDCLNQNLSQYRELTRESIKNYGRRMCYKFSYNRMRIFFLFVAQIGDGLVLHGMTVEPDAILPSPWMLPVWRVSDSWVPEEQQ